MCVKESDPPTLLMTNANRRPRVLSGMRPTGMLHLGHYFLLKKWVQLQETCDCNFFIADYHALTTAADLADEVENNTLDMVVCWLAAGIDPEKSNIFVQSQLREHAELHLILSMVCPLPWLERVPHYKDIASKSKPEDINYGFLGYPVLQAADIVLHLADYVPVGEDQEAHVEITAKLARSFNNQFGKPKNWQELVNQILNEFPEKEELLKLKQNANEKGDATSLQTARELILASKLTMINQQYLLGWLENNGREVLIPPQVMKAPISKLPGLDGKKMSKSDNNDIGMLEEYDSFAKKIKIMPTDPARVKRTDPGDPEKCPVWDYHKIFSSDENKMEVQEGCTTASIGCIDCKKMLSNNIEIEIAPLRDKAKPWLADKKLVANIIAEGNQKAQICASQVMRNVRNVAGLPPA